MSGTTATGWLLHTLAGGGLLLLLAWAWAAWTRQPVRRLRLAEWAVAASLLLAVLSLGPAWLVITTPAAATHQPASDAGAVANTASSLVHPGGSDSSSGDEPRRRPPGSGSKATCATKPRTAGVRQSTGDAARPCRSGSTGAAPAAVIVEANAPPAWSWDADRIASVGAALYLAAAAAVLGRWLFGWAALRRLLRRCEHVTGRAADLFAEMAGPGNRPRLLASRRTRAPFSCGLLRPTVVLPAGLCETRPTRRCVGCSPMSWPTCSGATPGRACCSAWRRRSTSPYRGSGLCAARPGSARNTWPTRPRRPPAAGPKITHNSCSPGRPRPDFRSARAASGGDLPISFGG